jgi:hypothetical protein
VLRSGRRRQRVRRRMTKTTAMKKTTRTGMQRISWRLTLPA